MTVYYLGSLGRDGMTPIKIVLAGAAMTALFTSFTQGMLVVNETGLQNVMFWLAGSVAGKSAEGLIPVLPYMIFAGIAALVLAQPVNILSSGEDIAKGLGQRTGLVKISIAVTVILLAGSSVAVAGSIGFVGLVIPHIARFLVGVDYRWIIPYSAVLGAILLLLADIVARFVIMPGELPIGVMTALIGVPFFYLHCQEGVSLERGFAMKRLVVFRSKTGHFSFLVQKKTMIVLSVLTLLLLFVLMMSIGLGNKGTSLADVYKTILGQGTAVNLLIIGTLRLPRIILAVLVGAALGVSGSIFRALSAIRWPRRILSGLQEGPHLRQWRLLPILRGR